MQPWDSPWQSFSDESTRSPWVFYYNFHVCWRLVCHCLDLRFPLLLFWSAFVLLDVENYVDWAARDQRYGSYILWVPQTLGLLHHIMNFIGVQEFNCVFHPTIKPPPVELVRLSDMAMLELERYTKHLTQMVMSRRLRCYYRAIVAEKESFIMASISCCSVEIMPFSTWFFLKPIAGNNSSWLCFRLLNHLSRKYDSQNRMLPKRSMTGV